MLCFNSFFSISCCICRFIADALPFLLPFMLLHLVESLAACPDTASSHCGLRRMTAIAELEVEGGCSCDMLAIGCPRLVREPSLAKVGKRRGIS
jgi:hypothetical protein